MYIYIYIYITDNHCISNCAQTAAVMLTDKKATGNLRIRSKTAAIDMQYDQFAGNKTAIYVCLQWNVYHVHIVLLTIE